MKNPTQQTKHDDLQTLARSHERYEDLTPKQQVAEKLYQLQAFLVQLGKTPHGKADLARRTKRFGPCTRAEDERAQDFYGRLRAWLDASV